jgi:hypothetical protein
MDDYNKSVIKASIYLLLTGLLILGMMILIYLYALNQSTDIGEVIDETFRQSGRSDSENEASEP